MCDIPSLPSHYVQIAWPPRPMAIVFVKHSLSTRTLSYCRLMYIDRFFRLSVGIVMYISIYSCTGNRFDVHTPTSTVKIPQHRIIGVC
jgi:hypothetical protein